MAGPHPETRTGFAGRTEYLSTNGTRAHYLTENGLFAGYAEEDHSHLYRGAASWGQGDDDATFRHSSSDDDEQPRTFAGKELGPYDEIYVIDKRRVVITPQTLPPFFADAEKRKQLEKHADEVIENKYTKQIIVGKRDKETQKMKYYMYLEPRLAAGLLGTQKIAPGQTVTFIPPSTKKYKYATHTSVYIDRESYFKTDFVCLIEVDYDKESGTFEIVNEDKLTFSTALLDRMLDVGRPRYRIRINDDGLTYTYDTYWGRGSTHSLIDGQDISPEGTQVPFDESRYNGGYPVFMGLKFPQGEEQVYGRGQMPQGTPIKDEEIE